MLRCDDCKKHIIQDTKHNDWLRLMHFIEFLMLNEEISVELQRSMSDSLMTFKSWAFEEEKETK